MSETRKGIKRRRIRKSTRNTKSIAAHLKKRVLSLRGRRCGDWTGASLVSNILT
jgi:hypothetical protein